MATPREQLQLNSTPNPEYTEIEEFDEVGRPLGTYILSKSHSSPHPVSPQHNQLPSQRLDYIPNTTSPIPLAQRVLSIFLPSGYPTTVSPDYTRYQIFDSLQAFASSIASLFASRAVLQSLGVGDSSATARDAILLNILQESVGRIGTIWFAHWASRRIEAECKTYRLLADVFNDASFVMDCLSPSLPRVVRVPVLCASTVARAVCGVAGGSSKALLSAHFARGNNLGEVNAKDASQETVISLLGMWVGGMVVSRVEGGVAVWVWLMVLLAVHLLTNYVAVRAVELTVLNRQRVGIAFAAFLRHGGGEVPGPAETARLESIFPWAEWKRYPKIGVSLSELFRGTSNIPGSAGKGAKSHRSSDDRLFAIFGREEYILRPALRRSPAAIALTSEATVKTQLNAWCHALRLSMMQAHVPLSSDTVSHDMKEIDTSLVANNEQFEAFWKALQTQGWDLSNVLLETSPGHRFRKSRDWRRK